MAACPWNTLPTELKLDIVGFLANDGVKSLSEVNREANALCLPSLFRNVTLNDYEALLSFRRDVPKPYPHIRSLFICLKPSSAHSDPIDQTGALVDILSFATRVESLSLHFIGSPTKAIIPLFRTLKDLRSLHVSNCGREDSQPLSERLVVSIALEIPLLRELSLDAITRSQIHAQDLYATTTVPVVVGDADIEDHPIVGSALSLPSLLQIPTLQRLRIRDTHLGDRRWESATCRASLSALDLGSSPYISPELGGTYVKTIIGNVTKACSINQLAIAVGLNQIDFQHSTASFNDLRHLELTAFFPIDYITDTLLTLSGSPLETIVVQCFNVDVEDLCKSLETFLNERAERRPIPLQQLKQLFITLIPFEGDEETAGRSSSQLYKMLDEGQCDAITTLETLCGNMGLTCGTLGVNARDSSCYASVLGFGGLRHASARSYFNGVDLMSGLLRSSGSCS